MKEQLYKKYARFYDKIYIDKNYEKEVRFVKDQIKMCGIKGKNLLDMACGTGNHARILAQSGFNVTGVDINKEMIKIAKSKVKDASFVKGSMQTFKSKEKSDIVTCLFTSINYNKNISELKATLKNFYNLLNPYGILIFDLGLVSRYEGGKSDVFIDTYVENNLQIGRIGQWKESKKDPNLYIASYIILIKEKGKFDFVIDKHELCLFSVKEVRLILKDIGFDTKVYNDFTLNKFRKGSKRPIFVCLKSERS